MGGIEEYRSCVHYSLGSTLPRSSWVRRKAMESRAGLFWAVVVLAIVCLFLAAKLVSNQLGSTTPISSLPTVRISPLPSQDPHPATITVPVAADATSPVGGSAALTNGVRANKGGTTIPGTAVPSGIAGVGLSPSQAPPSTALPVPASVIPPNPPATTIPVQPLDPVAAATATASVLDAIDGHGAPGNL